LRQKYRVLGLLGRGGFGIVYEAVDIHLKRHYAIKVILSETDTSQQQVLTEAEIMAQYARRFEFMPEIYDIWHEGARTTLVMEFVEGETLGELLSEQGPFSAAAVLDFLRITLADLARLHAADIIHRDLKPDNIKRTPDGRYMLLDFGIAKQEGSTLAGAKAFSPSYASPEQMGGHSTDGRSDLYSLGATAYHLLTGTAPPSSIYRRAANVPLPPPSAIVPDLPPALERTIVALLEVEPADRPADPAAALALLDASEPAPATVAVIAQPPARSTAQVAEKTPARAAARRERRLRPGWIGLGLVLLAVLAGAGWWWLQRSPPSAGTPDPAALRAVITPANAAQVVELDRFGEGHATTIAYDPQSSILAVGTSLGIELWDTSSWQRTTIITGFTHPSKALAWSKDGVLASANGPVVSLWNRDGSQRGELRREGPSDIELLAWSPDGTLIAGADFAAVMIWNVASQIRSEFDSQEGITALAWHPYSEMVASAARDSTIKVWQLDGTPVATISDHTDWVEGLAWNPDGNRLASASSDMRVGVWSMDTNQMTFLSGHTSRVVAVAWSADGRTLASGSRDGTIRLWQDGAAFKTLSGHSGSINGLQWSQTQFDTSNTLLSTSQDGTARQWDDTGAALLRLDAQNGDIRAFAWSPNDQLLTLLTAGEQLHNWKIDGTAIGTLTGYTPPVHTAIWNGAGDTLLIGGESRDAALWQPSSDTLRLLSGHTNDIHALAWSPDETTVVAASNDPALRWWKSDGTLIRSFELPAIVQALAWSSEGKLAAGADNGLVYLWEPDGSVAKAVLEHSAGIRVLAWSPDGKRLAVGCDDGSLTIWDVASATKLTLTAPGHAEGITALDWRPDGARLISASWDDTARIWNADGSFAVLQGDNSGDVTSADWSADGSVVATGAADGSIRLWQADGTLITVIRQHQNAVRALSWNAGDILASASADSTVGLWSKQGLALAMLSGHRDRVFTLAWRPDQRELVSAGEDGTLRIWGIK
jgi:WD40 repeat protein/predicted Ser/Thr protein kinase